MQAKPRSLSSNLFAIATLAGVAACGSSTTLEQAWTTPTATTQPQLQRVVTVFFSENTTMRHAGEDQLARELAGRGVQATPSYAILQDEELGDLKAVKSRFLAMGYDGIVTMRVVDQHQEVEYVSPTFDGYWGYASPYFYTGGGWYSGYYGGYTYVETVVQVETTAYSLRTNQLVWSALTRTVDEDTDDLLEETSELVASQLTERGLAG